MLCDCGFLRSNLPPRGGEISSCARACECVCKLGALSQHSYFRHAERYDPTCLARFDCGVVEDGGKEHAHAVANSAAKVGARVHVDDAAGILQRLRAAKTMQEGVVEAEILVQDRFALYVSSV